MTDTILAAFKFFPDIVVIFWPSEGREKLISRHTVTESSRAKQMNSSYWHTRRIQLQRIGEVNGEGQASSAF